MRKDVVNNKKRFIPLILLAAVLAMAGCTKSAAPGTSQKVGGTAPPPEKPLDVSVMSIYYSKEPVADDNVILKEIEKRTNTHIKITWVSPNNYTDKQNVTLASGDIPDLMFISDPFGSQVRTMVAQGAFWDISNYMKDYPNLMKFPENSWNNIRLDSGRIYGVPRVRPIEGGGFPLIRKDWLDKLNLKVPQTMDEMYAALKAFTKNDPDGNGKNDTNGLAGYISPGANSFSWVENVFTGTNGKWKLQNGKLVDMTLEPNMREALLWLNNLYKEGIIPSDFAVLKPTQVKDMVIAGKAGSYLDTVDNGWEISKQLRRTVKEADLMPMTSLTGPFGKYSNRDSGFFGMFVIPKKVPEAKLKKLLALLDYGASDEGSDLANYGIKGVHYKEENGFKLQNEQADKDNVSQQALGQIFLKYDKYLRAYNVGIPKDLYDRNVQIIDERAKVSVPDPSVGIFSETELKLGADFNQKIMDMKTKVIMGKETIQAWDDFVSRLKTDADYQKIIQEKNNYYQKKNAGAK